METNHQGKTIRNNNEELQNYNYEIQKKNYEQQNNNQITITKKVQSKESTSCRLSRINLKGLQQNIRAAMLATS